MSGTERQAGVPATPQSEPSHNHACEWKALYELEKKRTAQQSEEISALLKTICSLTENGKDVPKDDEPDDSSDESDNEELPDAIWDAGDDIERCTECGFEVVVGVCHCCGANFAHDSDDDSDEEIARGAFTEDALVHPDRFPIPRGTTPLQEIETCESLPGDWKGTPQMYESLMERGATRHMIATFQMQFFHNQGIVAWADDTIYDHFSGPGMRKGDQWMIMLGRRIKLDKADRDGSIFIEDLLEDAIVGSSPAAAKAWETVRLYEGSKIWVTRPIINRSNFDEEMLDDEEECTMYEQTASSEDSEGEIRENMVEDKAESPVLRFDEYEDSDVDSDDVAGEPEPVFVDANAPDDSDNDYESSDEEDQLETLQGFSAAEPGVRGSGIIPREEALMMAIDDDDEPGSDWDSDEELSGDEVFRSV